MILSRLSLSIFLTFQRDARPRLRFCKILRLMILWLSSTTVRTLQWDALNTIGSRASWGPRVQIPPDTIFIKKLYSKCVNTDFRDISMFSRVTHLVAMSFRRFRQQPGWRQWWDCYWRVWYRLGESAVDTNVNPASGSVVETDSFSGCKTPHIFPLPWRMVCVYALIKLHSYHQNAVGISKLP